MRRIAFAFTMLLFTIPVLHAGSPQGYYRFPTLAGDRIIFTSEGDLWTVGISGGLAQRLTSNLRYRSIRRSLTRRKNGSVLCSV